MNSPTHSTHESERLSWKELPDILEIARERASIIYHDRPLLCQALQESYGNALQACNDELERILHQQLEAEWWITDDYNQNRAISAAWQITADEAALEPVPDVLDSLLLRSQVAPYRADYSHPPLSQGPPSPPSPVDTGATNTANAPPNKVKKTKKGEKERTGGEGYDKLAGAPSMSLPFPDGNITLAEICAFLPQSIKSWDIIDRLIWNGVTTVTLVTMINKFRDMPRGNIENSAIYRMMKGQAGHRARQEPQYKGWTVGAHQNIPKPPGYDPGSNTAPDVLFRDLANGVKIWPSEFDALDLTRCVHYCVDHPEEDWFYPSDFGRLLAGLPQYSENERDPPGPAVVYYEHTDAASVERHTSSAALKNAKDTYKRKRDNRGRLLRKSNALSKVDEESSKSEHSYDSGEDNDDQNSKAKSKSTKSKQISGKTLNEGDQPAIKRRKPSTKARVNRKMAAKAPKKRSLPKTGRPRHQREIRLEDLESESEPEAEPEVARSPMKRKAASQEHNSDNDSDNYQGPKRQKKGKDAVVRKSRRTKRFGGSYDVDAALQTEEE
ncbi:predicted protein [Plenodomus lingam JN3]|uniref:Uncharacterized protein n=1 Tax=Leptosphaeria maculans (strain JN3 / isolate v23.1.3 / race Av1-4-5-6-7-8) TaxID=985895 RepID=E5A5X9_LEPMJ|nr:predicted protein [Plenodomus lingam JN3]CBX99024.1 predicted protein [Plenodomus lingam JN3]